jgi:hypothetical protein
MMVILTTFIAPPLLRFVFQEPESDTTPSEKPALDGVSTGVMPVQPTANRRGSPEEAETAGEQKKGS